MQFTRDRRRWRVGPKAAALSILLFWTFYYLSVSARSVLMGYPGFERMFDNRALVTVSGMGLTWLLYLLLRRFDERPLRTRVAAAFLASLPVAAAYAAVNHLAFYDPQPPEPDVPTDRHDKGLANMIAENAIHWYFFIACWAALYLALSYAAQVRESEREAARFRAAAQSAELRALRYQVNPHFLFNTLNSISSLVMAGRNTQAEEMILNLSRFFRTGLATDPTEDVPLADEIALQRLYLEIEAVRFPDRLRTELAVEPGLEDACVPGMILQPLVENAIRHAVSPSRRPVTVRIAARRARGRLRLDVEDDGGAVEAVPRGTGVGLRNVCDRLHVRFGDDAAVASGRREGGGYNVTLLMPLVLHEC